jgi:haloalkane dehalogenase
VDEVFRTPDECFEGLDSYAFAPRYIELSGEFAGLRMHHVDEGEGDPVLLLHGEPTWAYLYRKMIPRLAEVSRVVVPDYIGFGRSDKVTDVAWYRYDRHVASIAEMIEELNLEQMTLVVHDWGGPIGLRIALEHPERVTRLVILNTGLFRPGPGWPSPVWLQFRDFVVDRPDLPVGDLIQMGTTSNLSPEVLAGYEAPFPNPASKAGPVAFPQLVPLGEHDPGAAEMAAVRSGLSRWEKPALVLFSDSDPIFPVRAGERMAERIPGARFVTIEGGSHFLQEDRGESVAEEIVSFLATS